MLLCNLEIHLHRLSDPQYTLVDKMLAALLTGHFPPPESLLTIYRSYMHAVFMVGVEREFFNEIYQKHCDGTAGDIRWFGVGVGGGGIKKFLVHSLFHE